MDIFVFNIVMVK